MDGGRPQTPDTTPSVTRPAPELPRGHKDITVSLGQTSSSNPAKIEDDADRTPPAPQPMEVLAPDTDPPITTTAVQ